MVFLHSISGPDDYYRFYLQHLNQQGYYYLHISGFVTIYTNLSVWYISLKWAVSLILKGSVNFKVQVRVIWVTGWAADYV